MNIFTFFYFKLMSINVYFGFFPLGIIKCSYNNAYAVGTGKVYEQL